MHLPWSDRLDSKDLLEEEVVRQLVIMKTSEPESDEYRKAVARYNLLHEHSLKEKKLSEHKRSRWFEGFMTAGLATTLLTAESWTPLTSKWWTGLTRRFRVKDDDINLKF